MHADKFHEEAMAYLFEVGDKVRQFFFKNHPESFAKHTPGLIHAPIYVPQKFRRHTSGLDCIGLMGWSLSQILSQKNPPPGFHIGQMMIDGVKDCFALALTGTYDNPDEPVADKFTLEVWFVPPIRHPFGIDYRRKVSVSIKDGKFQVDPGDLLDIQSKVTSQLLRFISENEIVGFFQPN